MVEKRRRVDRAAYQEALTPPTQEERDRVRKLIADRDQELKESDDG